MDEIEVTAKIRTEKGKNVANRLRVKNEIPGILYGSKTESTPLILSAKDIQKIISTKAGENVLINLKLQGKEDRPAMIKEIQTHPVTGELLHVDLYQITLTGEINVNVPIQISGEAPGVKLGGTLEHHLREIKVKCLPTKIPTNFTVDISSLNMGDSMHVKDLKIPEGIKILDDLEEVIMTVSAPKVEEEKPVEEGAPTGPEVIGEKEREERRAEAEKTKEERAKEKVETKTQTKEEETKK